MRGAGGIGKASGCWDAGVQGPRSTISFCTGRGRGVQPLASQAKPGLGRAACWGLTPWPCPREGTSWPQGCAGTTDTPGEGRGPRKHRSQVGPFPCHCFCRSRCPGTLLGCSHRCWLCCQAPVAPRGWQQAQNSPDLLLVGSARQMLCWQGDVSQTGNSHPRSASPQPPFTSPGTGSSPHIRSPSQNQHLLPALGTEGPPRAPSAQPWPLIGRGCL